MLWIIRIACLALAGIAAWVAPALVSAPVVLVPMIGIAVGSLVIACWPLRRA